ncbi:PX domain-containing protein ypt35 [Ascosphaera aggregata]|nr:PX domain-containing protein ypt35 [Ascosphaera aggregata]
MESSSKQSAAAAAAAGAAADAAGSSSSGNERRRDSQDHFRYTTVGAWPSDTEEAYAVSEDDEDDEDESYETAPDEADRNEDVKEYRRNGLFSSLQRSTRKTKQMENEEERDRERETEEGNHDDKTDKPCPPAFWSRHHREPSTASTIKPTASAASTHPSMIRLEDHTQERFSQTGSGLWARSVSIDDHVVVKGKTGVGAYTVWICRIQTLEGGVMTIRMRYSEFVELRARLYQAFPYARHSLPALPPKSALMRFNSKFLRKRREGLHYFLNCVLLNPEFSGAPVLKEFLLARI